MKRSFLLRITCGILFGCCCLQCFAHGITQSNHQSVYKRKQVAYLLDSSLRFPVEYQAALLYLVLDNAPDALTRSQQIDRLSLLFTASSKSRYRSPFRESTGTPAGLLGHISFDVEYLHLDELDIQMEVVKRLSGLRSARAAQLFGQVHLPAGSVSCALPAVPIYQAYYETLGRGVYPVSTSAHSQASSALAKAVGSISSASALSSYLQVIQTQIIEQSDLPVLLTGLTLAFEQLNPSDRELLAFDHDGELSGSVMIILSQMSRYRIDTTRFLAAYRAFLIRGLSREKCSDSSLMRNTVRDEFEKLRSFSAYTRSLEPLQVNEMQGKPGRSAYEDVVRVDPKISSVIQRLFTLSDANRVRRYIAHDLTALQPEENDVTAVFLLSQEDYEKENSCQMCRFIARQGVISTLLNILPKGPSLQEAIRQEVSFLQLNPARDSDPPVWYLTLQQSIATTRKTDAVTSKAIEQAAMRGRNLVLTPSEEADTLRKALAESGDPLIKLFWKAEQILSPPYQTYGLN